MHLKFFLLSVVGFPFCVHGATIAPAGTLPCYEVRIAVVFKVENKRPLFCRVWVSGRCTAREAMKYTIPEAIKKVQQQHSLTSAPCIHCSRIDLFSTPPEQDTEEKIEATIDSTDEGRQFNELANIDYYEALKTVTGICLTEENKGDLLTTPRLASAIKSRKVAVKNPGYKRHLGQRFKAWVFGTPPPLMGKEGGLAPLNRVVGATDIYRQGSYNKVPFYYNTALSPTEIKALLQAKTPATPINLAPLTNKKMYSLASICANLGDQSVQLLDWNWDPEVFDWQVQEVVKETGAPPPHPLAWARRPVQGGAAVCACIGAVHYVTRKPAKKQVKHKKKVMNGGA